jgi:glycosyltransferase involved in cell wall biosynthesis
MNITAIILIFNEELNLEACLSSISHLTKDIVIIDSGSTDRSLEIAQKFTSQVYTHKFINHANQFNWALDTVNINGDWILRLDADERLTKELVEEIKQLDELNLINSITNGFILKFRTFFMNQELRYGGVYPFKKLVLFKKGYGRYENKNMDEHILLDSGTVKVFKNNALHYDYKDLHSLIHKHNVYATSELKDYISNNFIVSRKLASRAIQSNRKKKATYYKLPIFLRALLLFIYNYFFRMGFLDGKKGLIYHFITTFYYRFIIDAKIYEYKVLLNKNIH